MMKAIRFNGIHIYSDYIYWNLSASRQIYFYNTKGQRDAWIPRYKPWVKHPVVIALNSNKPLAKMVNHQIQALLLSLKKSNSRKHVDAKSDPERDARLKLVLRTLKRFYGSDNLTKPENFPEVFWVKSPNPDFQNGIYMMTREGMCRLIAQNRLLPDEIEP